MLLKAAINGARRPGAHPMLPTTPVAIGWAAAAAAKAGAGAVHFHVRGADQAESLLADDVARTVAAVRLAVPSTPFGVSTGLWIVGGDAARRLALVRGWRPGREAAPDFASVNFHEEGAAALATELIAAGVDVEAGLFDASAAEAFVASGLAGKCLRVMLEPRGSTVGEALETARAIEGVLDRARIREPRLLHGSGATAWPLVAEAARRGYDTRAGLEDMLTLPDGRAAADNGDIVAAARRLIDQTVR
jgi:uncharacterized protein (DUF849 family)